MPKSRAYLRHTKAQENEHRRERAESALQAYGEEFGPNPVITDEDVLTDLLTDLRHFCGHHGIDFDKSVRLSETNYESEK